LGGSRADLRKKVAYNTRLEPRTIAKGSPPECAGGPAAGWCGAPRRISLLPTHRKRRDVSVPPQAWTCPDVSQAGCATRLHLWRRAVLLCGPSGKSITPGGTAPAAIATSPASGKLSHSRGSPVLLVFMALLIRRVARTRQLTGLRPGEQRRRFRAPVRPHSWACGFSQTPDNPSADGSAPPAAHPPCRG